MYEVNKGEGAVTTQPLISGYEVFRFGVPMIGEYVNAIKFLRKSIIISAAVPGAEYRITALALDSSKGNSIPAIKYVTTREASESISLSLNEYNHDWLSRHLSKYTNYVYSQFYQCLA